MFSLSLIARIFVSIIGENLLSTASVKSFVNVAIPHSLGGNVPMNKIIGALTMASFSMWLLKRAEF